MDEQLDEFHTQIVGWARRGLSAVVIADRLAELGLLAGFRQVRRYCREAGIPLVDGEMPAETAAQRDLQQLARAADPGPRRPLPPPPFPPVVKRGQWPMSRPLIYFNEFALTLGQAYEGIFAFGATGSGKSSGSGQAVVHAVFWVGAGVVIFIVKAGEAAVYIRWAAECGRLQHVCVFEAGGKYRFNFFEYLTRHPSPGVSSEQNVTRVLEALAEISAGGSGGGGENAAFWTNNRRQVLSCAIRILARSGEPLTLPRLKTFIREAPLEARDVQQGAYKRTTVFGPCLAAAVARSRGTPDEEPVREACEFFLQERPAQPETTRASVAMDINSMIEAFIGNPMMRELFCTDTNLVPEHCLEGGLIVVNVPVTEYGTQGILANTIWKLLVQQALERRSDPPNENRIPVAMITDEVHYLYTPADTLFTSTCRSVSCITIGITQSLPAFYARIPAHNSQHVVDGYLANFVTKVFHYNNDPTTLTYMAEQLGRSRRFRVSGGDKKKSWLSQLFGGGGGSGGDDGISVNSELTFNVPPEKFTQLRTGGPENNYEVDAYVVLGPRAYRQIGQHYALVTFRQCGEGAEGVVDDHEISNSRPGWRRLKGGLRRLIGF